MVNALLRLIRAVLALVWLVELAGASLVVTGIWLSWGRPAGLIAAGVALLAKSLEMDMRRSDGS